MAQGRQHKKGCAEVVLGVDLCIAGASRGLGVI